MKITAFVGSGRKNHTYNATKQFLEKLKSLGAEDVEYEIVMLSDYKLNVCRGCQVCFQKGEEFCPLKDDRDKLIKKIIDSDGVIFASPNYSFQVSGNMKIFLDRLGFAFHRPRFFGKTYTSIVSQGIYGGGSIVKYLNFVGNGLGFNVVKGSYITTIDPMTEKSIRKMNDILNRQSKRFYSKLIKEKYPSPPLLKLMAFRMGRTSIKILLNEKFKDYRYYKEKGWFKSDYYYPTKLNPPKKLVGKFFDKIAIPIFTR